MSKSFRISLIGTGNVAWHLGAQLEYGGHRIEEVYGRDIKKAKNLCTRLYEAKAVDHLDFRNSKAEIVLIMVKDDAIEEIATSLLINEKTIIAHTSGTKSLYLLNYPHAGVFYPVQTFTQGKKLSLDEVPICIETTDEFTEKILAEVAGSISRHVYYLEEEKRKILHLAAVFANNFTNHLLSIAKTILDAEQIDFKILNALARETIEKAFITGPEHAQTGPAKRKDGLVLSEHLALLENRPEIKTLYKLLSENILKFTGS